MENNKFIYEENGYIKINSSTKYNQIINSKLIGKNLAGLGEAINNIDNLNKSIGEDICDINKYSAIIYALMSLNAFIEIDSEEYERTILIKNFIKKNHAIDLKENEKIVSIIFKKPKKNQYISVKSILIDSNYKFYVSTFLEVNKDKIDKVYITTNLTDKMPKREITVELMLIDKIINDRLIKSACRTIKILSKNYLNIMDEEVTKLLYKCIDECYKNIKCI